MFNEAIAFALDEPRQTGRERRLEPARTGRPGSLTRYEPIGGTRLARELQWLAHLERKRGSGPREIEYRSCE